MKAFLQGWPKSATGLHSQTMGVRMLWRGGRRSGNLVDRRGMRPGFVGGGLGGLLLIILALIFGVDPRGVIDPGPGGEVPVSAADDERKDFVAAVLGFTEDVWTELFREAGRPPYREPELVLFTGAVQSACGFGQAAMGPFYCPPDERVYLDMSFFQELHNRFKAPGDFAQAYVIAHEVGHHVQNLLGVTGRVPRSNQASVRVELQADCLAGVWANHVRDVLETGDIEEALNAASAIGDDRLQMQTRGYVVPESFTHGTAEQRAHWFRQGFQSGQTSACDTFR